MTDIKKTGLYLLFGDDSPTFEMECNNYDCEGTGTCDNDTGLPFLKRCPRCRGTGKRTVRLVSREKNRGVEVDYFVSISHDAGENNDETIEEYYVQLPNIQDCRLEVGGCDSFEEARDLLILRIVQAYRAGTLPKEIADGLHEEEVTG